MTTLTPEDRARLRDLASRATPGPWEAEWDLGEGELTVSAGTAQTKWDSDSGTPPSTYNPTDRILEWDDVWPEDGGEQREADADFIAAARTALPVLLDALDEADERGKYLMEQWDGAEVEVEELAARADRAEATVERVRKWAQEASDFYEPAGDTVLVLLDGDA